MVTIAGFPLAATIASYSLTHLCKRLARQLGVVAEPRVDRWRPQPVPLLGGLAIATTVWLATPFAITLSEPVAVLFVGTVVLFGLGLFDDVRSLPPPTKFIVQILVAAGLASIGIQLHLTSYPVVNVLLTLLWVVGITNAFNLLDNMDGLAAGIAVITAGFRLGFFVMDGNFEGPGWPGSSWEPC